jgi:hypothetical protein
VIELRSKHLSRVIGWKQIKVVDGQLTHKGEPIRCHWCKWTPGSDDITIIKGADGLLLGGFTKVTQIARLAKHGAYRLAVHSCQRGQANPLVVLVVGREAEPMVAMV